MKLNKPKVTESQSVLEDYVTSLLVDPSKKAKSATQSELSAVPDLNKDTVNLVTNDKHQNRSKEVNQGRFGSSTDENPVLKDIVSDVIPLNKKRVKSEPSGRTRGLDKPVENIEEHDQSEDSSVEQLMSPSLDNNQERVGEKHDFSDNKQTGAEPLAVQRTNDIVQSQALQQNHTNKIEQEIEDYSSQNFVQKDFKEGHEKDPRLQGVEKLLAKIALANVLVDEEKVNEKQPNKSTEPSVDLMSEDATEITVESSQASFAHREKQPLKSILGSIFQTLVFEVGNLPLAVPLIKLGGIVNFSEQDITSLVGTPDWFMGLVPHEKGNLMVINTQQFLMPEQNYGEDKPYRYLIILDDSLWALACHSVGDAKNLTPEDIRWSSGSSRRPWFAGMVVEYMSALIEVDRLINMLTDQLSD